MGWNNNKKTKSLRSQLVLVAAMDLLYFLTFFINGEAFLDANHCIVLAIQTWISLLLIDFAVEYTNTGLRVNKPVRTATVFLCMLDSIMMIVNAFSSQFFGFRTREHKNMKVVVPVINGFYIFHILLVVFMLLIFLYVIFQAIKKASNTRKKRYIIILVAFLIGLLSCEITRIIGLNENSPIIVVINIGEMIIYIVYFLMPKSHENRMKEFAMNNVAIPVVIFDDEEKLEYANSTAMEILDIEEGQSLDSFIEGSNLSNVLSKERRMIGKTKFFSSTVRLDRKTYLLSGQELWDKDNYNGRILIYNDITNNERLKSEAVYNATRDTLTGLWNREFFIETVDDILNEQPDREYLMVVSDLYRFKMFNDILGMDAGDDLLKTIAKALKSYGDENWISARVTGDRFALFMPVEHYNEEIFINNCRKEIEKKNFRISVRFYLGVYKITDRRLHAADIYDRAFMALESIKGSGDACVAYYDEAIRTKKIDETLSIVQLERAMAANQFIIYLQPQINIMTGKINGCEALVRWDSPSRGLVPPDVFIQAFENNGMIPQLDYYVWDKACALLAEWKKAGYENRSISVNISAKDFYLTDLIDSICGLVEKYDIDPKCLRLEITETAFVNDVELQMEIVGKLRKYGFVVEIDDFGSGYSSLNSLKDINADILKIDMKFFEKTDNPERAEKIIESIIMLANKLKMPVIAEGVEEDSQVEMLKRMGCGTVQGYYYSKPLPVDMFESFVQNFGGCFERI